MPDPSQPLNPELKGRGTLEVRADPTAYRFTGTRRGFPAGHSMEMDFAPEDITDVRLKGAMVSFSTSKGRSGQLGRPFVFFCRDAGDAMEAARLLPANVSRDFAEARDFGLRLRRLPSANSPLGSVTNAIIALNVIVFVVMAGFLGAGWFATTDITPYVLYGANNAAATTDGEWWRLVTSMFMHYGFLHLALNMWALFQVGQLLERLQGRALYALTYLVSGIGGGFLSMVWNGDRIWSAGASGAIFGVYGAVLGYMLREKQALPKSVFRPMMKSTVMFAGYNLLYGLAHPGIDNGAHVGGFVTGIGLGFLTALPLDPVKRDRMMGSRLALAVAAGAAIVVAGVAGAPRFDYSPRDEFKWNAAVTSFGPRERDLLSKLDADLSVWRRTGKDPDRDELGRLIEGKLIPFYASLARTIDALALEPGRQTDLRRKALSQYAHLRLEAFQHLMRAVDQNDTAEYKTFGEFNSRA